MFTSKLISIFLVCLVYGMLILKVFMILRKELTFLGSKQTKTVLQKFDAWFGIITSAPVLVGAIIVLIIFLLLSTGLVH
jgi:hypothetical protein